MKKFKNTSVLLKAQAFFNHAWEVKRIRQKNDREVDEEKSDKPL